MVPASFPPTGPCSGSPFAPAGPSAQFPAFFATTRCSDSLHPSRRASFPSLAGTARVPLFAPAAGGSLRQAWTVLRERPITIPGGGNRASQVPGIPQFQRAPLSDSGETFAPGHLRRLGSAFCVTHCIGSHIYAFRSSITRPTGSLCTLRSLGYPSTTQHSVPAAGQLYRTGFSRRG